MGIIAMRCMSIIYFVREWDGLWSAKKKGGYSPAVP